VGGVCGVWGGVAGFDVVVGVAAVCAIGGRRSSVELVMRLAVGGCVGWAARKAATFSFSSGLRVQMDHASSS
jgi:hypothetical protein